MRGLMQRDDTDPQDGDTVVALRVYVQDDEPLDAVVLDMSAAFTQAMRGAALRRVLKFEPRTGEVVFVVKGGFGGHCPRHIEMKIQNWPDGPEEEAAA